MRWSALLTVVWFAVMSGHALALPLVVTAPTTDIDLSTYSGLDNFSDISFDSAAHAAVYDPDPATLIRNNVGASIIGDGGPAAIGLDGDVDTFINAGRIGDVGGSGVLFGATSTGPFTVGSFLNAATGTISGFNGLYATATHFASFTNDGSLSGDEFAAFFDSDSGVDNFINGATGTITTTGGLAALAFGDDVGSFDNAGKIGDSDVTGVGALFGDITGSLNSPGVLSYTDVGRIANSGSIAGLLAGTALAGASVDSVVNEATGTMSGGEAGFIGIESHIGSFSNFGVLAGSTGGGESAAVLLEDSDIETFTNQAGGQLTGSYAGFAMVDGHLGSFINNGYILGTSEAGLVFSTHHATVINTGTIEGDSGVLFDGTLWGRASLTNSGTIRGTGGTAIDFAYDPGCICGGPQHRRDDTLTILTGSKIFGAVNFGRGSDTLDFSGFIGNTVLDVPGLNLLVPGMRNYVWDRPDDKIAIFDLSWLGNATIGETDSDIVGSVADLIAANLASAALPAIEPPLNFAPETRQSPALAAATEQAVMSELDVTQHLGVRGWAGIIGGGSVQSALDQSRLYGGLVAGAHARLNQTFSVGGLAGLVQSSNTALSGSETLATSTGVAGLYGRAAFGVADIDFSLLGGASAHHSARQVVANNTVETATGLFSSVFVAPGFGISVPVLSSDLGEIRLVTTGNYVGGLVSAYTETGSSMNLVVGSQTIGVVDARIGIEIDRPATKGDSVTLTAKAGLLAQDNFGSASVPVTTFGSTLTVATPGGSAFGAYGGLKLDAALGNGLRLGAQLDGALRTDGVLSESAKFSLAGAF